MNATPEIRDAIRRRELAEQLEVMPRNERFIECATSTAFSLSLSRSMIVALCLLEQALHKDHTILRFPIGDSGLNGIERRGLIERWPIRREARPVGAKWSEITRITRAGELVLDLLAEASLIEPRVLRAPLPPPPPGWLDPRPKLDIRTGQFLPSDREQAVNGGTTDE